MTRAKAEVTREHRKVSQELQATKMEAMPNVIDIRRGTRNTVASDSATSAK